MELAEYKEHVGVCKACGNSPTQHHAQYMFATTGVWGARFAHFALRRKPLALFLDFCRILSDLFEQVSYRFGHRVGLIRFSREIPRAASYRSQVIWEEAERRGIRMEQLVLLKSYTDVYRAFINDRWFYFESLPIPYHLGTSEYLWIDDKFLLNETFRAAGLPVPYMQSVTTLSQALRAFKEAGGHVVTKPRVGSRARHTTTNIRSEAALHDAWKSARQLCRHVCVTRHLEGGVCRGTVVNGTLAGFFQGNPPQVVGDGVANIRTLIEGKNTQRHERVQPITITDEHEEFLARIGHSLESVPQKGVVIDLTHRTGRLFGGETRELLATVHPKLRTHVERAAQALAVPVVGFDLIIKDPESDPDTQEWGIIEANSLPFIDLHYLPLHGTPSNVAAQVWDLWKKEDPASAGSSSSRYARLFTTFSKTAG